MLGKRILTAIVAIPIAVYIINFGDWLFTAVTFLLAAIAWHEFASMLKKNGTSVCYGLGLLGVTAFLACGAFFRNSDAILAAALFLLIFVLMKTVIAHSRFSMTDAAFTVMGAFYIGLSFSCMFLLRFTGQGEYVSIFLGTISMGAFYIWLAFIATWASDTFAYFAGMTFGRRKLCPAISPAKTWEGAFGGLFGSVLAVIAVGLAGGLPINHLIVLGLLSGVFAPFGDLAESALKRFCSVKDSGNIFPGHGGVLDRFDAMMFSVPVVYFYVSLFLR
jgi:phosphatidate cytidylyltransferase